MAEDNHFPHIFIKQPQKITDYTSTQRGGGKSNIPERNRNRHGSFLKGEFKKLWQKSNTDNKNRQIQALPFKTGHYIEFRSKAGYELVTKSLENIRSDIRLLNIHEKKQEDNQEITAGTVYIPKDKMSFFLKKIEQYLNENTSPTNKQLKKNPQLEGKPKNKDLIESIEEIHLATLESFWRDDRRLIPKDSKSVECEVWLKTDALKPSTHKELKSSKQIDNFFKVCNQLNEKSTKHQNKTNKIEYNKNQSICFPERAVVLIKANKNHLLEIIKSCDDIAEFRRAKETALFWLEQENKDQLEWVKDLQKRSQVDKESKVSICLLDTGINNGHPLIKPVLSDKDCHTINPDWGIDDRKGHGTKMSGLAIYGDLQKALESNKQINIHHKLESVKLIPSDGTSNDPKLYGHLTKQGISRAEIEKPDRKRTICMTVTSKDDRDKGRPSSWSGAIDQIASGAEDNKKRLLIISAGNVEGKEEWNNYPNSNFTNTVHDPAQSWNALTVGAYTDKTLIRDEKLKGYKSIAKMGELSPFSSTSVTWETKKWPIKPDVVFEGGNVAKDKTNFVTILEDLSLLSLHYKPQERYFEMIYATSAATAQASWMASQIQSQYPEIWPETIRALMVHSADWKKSMKKQFWNNADSDKNNYKNTLRVFGYGVPNLDKALSSYNNSLTLVSEQIIQPFVKKNSNYTTKDMHFYQMPWPKEVLKGLPDQTVIKFRFTLSYFIEPGPGEIGWKDRYRYPSFGLRFSLIRPQETEDQFMKRINKIAENEEQNKGLEQVAGSDNRWKFGKQNTSLGSIHSDFWEATAQEIAYCNCMVVYPSTGWWKERQHLKQYDKKARYSLIISLSTPEESIDLYTPVATQIKIPIKT